MILNSEIIMLGILGLLTGLFVIYAFVDIKIRGDFLIKKQKHAWFWGFCLLSILCVIASKYLSPLYFPFSILAVFAMLYSGFEAAIIVIAWVSVIAAFISQVGICAFIAIFLPTILLLFLFRKPEKHFYYIKYTLIWFFVDLLFIAAFIYLSHLWKNYTEIVVILLSRVLELVLLMLCMRRFYHSYIIYEEELYRQLNDPEGSLLLELKKKNHEEYTIAVHSAYLCEKIAGAFNRKTYLCKAVGYYHRIGVIRPGKVSENTINILKENKYPEELIDIIEDYSLINTDKLISHEAVIGSFANDIVSSIRYLSKKKSDKSKDYDKIIDFVFKKKEDSGELLECSLSYKEMNVLKQCFKDEKTYYDFLH